MKVPSTNIWLKKEEAKFLVSKEEYISLYEKGQLGGHKINKEIIESKKIRKVDPVIIPAQTLNITHVLSSGKDATADPSSCESSAAKSKRQSDGFPSPDPKEKVEKGYASSFIEDCLYTQAMEEDVEVETRIYKIREFKAYFLSKILEP